MTIHDIHTRIMRSRDDYLLQVDFIVQMEDSKKLRRCGKLTHFVCSEDKNKNCILAKLDKMRGLDYKAQKKLVEELMENALDSEGGQKVYCIVYCITGIYLHVTRSI